MVLAAEYGRSAVVSPVLIKIVKGVGGFFVKALVDAAMCEARYYARMLILDINHFTR